MRKLVVLFWLAGVSVAAQQAAAPVLPVVAVHPIAPPRDPLPSEAASAGVTRFSFIAYGDTRSGGDPNVPGDGKVLHPIHDALSDLMLTRIAAEASTPYPIRFIVQSGDAVLWGPSAPSWNISFSPIIEKLTQANVPYFFAAGNHDVTAKAAGDPERAQGLHNTLTAMSQLIPVEGSPRRLAGYPTYAFGYGNLFALVIDSNIASDPLQLAWATDQLDRIDRRRFTHVAAFFHHPTFSSGPHGGAQVEAPTRAIREQWVPLFRRHHVRLIVAGHDHLLDHFVEHYVDNGVTYRRDDIVTGGGGAPTYLYKGEPDLTEYVAAGAAQSVRVDHLVKPGTTAPENPHHFLVIQVDGERLSIEVVALGDPTYAPWGGRSKIELSDSKSQTVG